MVNLGGRRFAAQRAVLQTHITVYRAARQLIWGLPVAFTESYRNSCPSTKGFRSLLAAIWQQTLCAML